MDKFSLEAVSAHSVGCTYASITWQGADMGMSTGWVTNTAAGLTYVVQKLTSASYDPSPTTGLYRLPRTSPVAPLLFAESFGSSSP